MTDTPPKKFSGRAFVSVLTTFSFIILAVTGLALFITPPGRVAHWTGWTFMMLTKEQWGALHILTCLVFLVTSLFHIYFNWKPLLNYFKNRAAKQMALRREWVLALILTIACCWGTLAEYPPFSTIMAFNETIKDSWEVEGQSAPIPHAELLTLAELARETETNLNKILFNLEEHGIKDCTADSILGDLAHDNNTTPIALYAIAMSGNEAGMGQGRGQGMGMGMGMGQGRGQGMGRATGGPGAPLEESTKK